MKAVKITFGAFVLALFLISPHYAAASGTFINAPNYADVVHDPIRNILYISGGSAIRRYSLSTNSFLSSFTLGGRLVGMDISPDGNTLAVADITPSATGDVSWIHLVDLQTGRARKVSLPTGNGFWSVAFDKNGCILVSSSYVDPLLRYDPATGEIVNLTENISPYTILSASGDREVVGFAEGEYINGRWGRYRASDGNIVHKVNDGTGEINFEMSVNRNGSQYALLANRGDVFIYDQSFHQITVNGVRAVGVAYHPTKDIVYFALAGTAQVVAYDTKTFQPIANYDVEKVFTRDSDYSYGDGRLKFSRDGSTLFVCVQGGITYLSLPRADLVIKAQTTASVTVGDIISHHIAVTNNGPETATAVKLTDALSPGMPLLQVSATRGQCSFASYTVSCLPGDLAPGESVSIKLTFRPQTAGSYKSTITAIANEFDPNSANSSLIRITKVLGLASFTLSATRVVGGQSVRGTLTLTDNAPSGGALVTLVDNLSAANVPQSVTIPAGKRTASFDITTQPVVTNQSGQITAKLGSGHIGRPLTIQPAP